MKKVVLVLVLALFPLTAFGHPGKTDRYGGHKCWKGCEEWDLIVGEYHLHDKDYMPIKADRKKVPLPDESDEGVTNTQVWNTLLHAEIPQTAVQNPAPVLPAEKPKEEIVTGKNVTTIFENSIFPFEYILLSSAGLLLLLLLLILRTTKKTRE